jgi:2-polyprenyl-3-methyl-5-hydroxy-6-metoxy-1,4-benzoquinol methylase
MGYRDVEKLKKSETEYKKNLSGMCSWIMKEKYVFDLIDSYNKDINILDICCGSGYFLDRLKEKGFKNISGADLGNYLADRQHKHTKVDLNTEKIPLLDSSFDVVTCFQGMEHLENYFLIVREVKRILKPGGTFIFSVPNQFNIFYRIKFMISGDMSGWSYVNDHLLFPTRSVFRKTYLKHFSLEDRFFRKGLVPCYGRFANIINKIFRLNLFHKLQILPRCEAFADDTCFVLKSKKK